MLSCGALERSNNPYIESIVKPCVSKSHKEWVWWEENEMKKDPWAESMICVYVCERKEIALKWL